MLTMEPGSVVAIDGQQYVTVQPTGCKEGDVELWANGEVKPIMFADFSDVRRLSMIEAGIIVAVARQRATKNKGE